MYLANVARQTASVLFGLNWRSGRARCPACLSTAECLDVTAEGRRLRCAGECGRTWTLPSFLAELEGIPDREAADRVWQTAWEVTTP
ncbi:MAG: hypothetical protein HYY25_05065 [Candidatus Wallbacteria bacterium]|nr:hypothetical protein [Candidatus Wallbacteria bacterium]